MRSVAGGRAVGQRVLAAGGASVVALGVTLGMAPIASAAYPNPVDGSIVFTSSRVSPTHPGGSANLWVVNPSGITPSNASSAEDTAATRQLTDSTADDHTGFYSPDGSEVVFWSDRTGTDQIWEVAAGNVPTAQDTTGSSPGADGAVLYYDDPGNDDSYPSFAPDGHTIAFIQGSNSVVVVDPTAATPTPIVVASAGVTGVDRPVFDPLDQTKLLYVADHHIMLVSGIGTSSMTTRDLSAATGIGSASDEYPDWSPDGTHIVFDSTRTVGANKGVHQLWTMTSSGTAAQPVFTNAGGTPTYTGYTDTQAVFSPSGKYLAFTRPTSSKDVNDTTVPLDASYQATTSSVADLTLAPSNPSDSEPDWQGSAATPPTSVPESPWTIGLPVAAAAMIGGSYLALRRRPRTV